MSAPQNSIEMKLLRIFGYDFLFYGSVNISKSRLEIFRHLEDEERRRAFAKEHKLEYRDLSGWVRSYLKEGRYNADTRTVCRPASCHEV